MRIIKSAFDVYQVTSHQTAVYDNVGKNINYVALGLSSEAGEVAGKVCKMMCSEDHGTLTEERREAIIKELGDVLWYVAEMATTLDMSFHDLAFKNVGKLSDRQKDGTLKGDGDDR